MSATVPDLFRLFHANADLRRIVGERMFQNQATEEANDPETGRAQAFLVVARRDASRVDVLRGADRNADPDEEAFDLDAVTISDPATAERIVELVTSILHTDANWATLT